MEPTKARQAVTAGSTVADRGRVVAEQPRGLNVGTVF
jgi:hypothetical protein